jgi:hypothetical protein
VHPGIAGHQLISDVTQRAIEAGCTALKPAAPPEDYAEQVCALGRSIGALVGSASGFAHLDPGNGRSSGLAATASGASVELRLGSRMLSRAFVSVAFEYGFRNHVVGTLRCVSPCACTSQLMNATNPARTTYSKFTDPLLLTLDDVGACVVRVTVEEARAGRLMLTAVTLSAPAHGRGAASAPRASAAGASVRRAGGKLKPRLFMQAVSNSVNQLRLP